MAGVTSTSRSSRAAVWVTVLLLAGLIAMPAAANAMLLAPAQPAAVCVKETKRLKSFKRGMKPATKRFFKTHAAKQARTRFLKRQRRKLAALKRARSRCLDRQGGGGPPSQAPGGPGPGAGGPGPGGPGPPSEPLARDAIVDVAKAEAVVEPGEVSTEDGVEYVRTQIELELEDGATAAELAALLAQLDGEVVSSLEGVPILTVRIPDPGSLDALRALVAGLAGEPGLAHADLLTLPVTTELPDNVQASDVSPVRPQLASFASGAWNAREALTGVTPPGFLIADFFGDGAPGGEVAATVTASDFVTGNPHAHGYTVLGLAAAAFESGATAQLQADQATGMWAGPALPLRAVDLRRSLAGSALQDRILQVVRQMPGDVVLNTSFADGCAAGPTGCAASAIERDARQWISRVRLSDLEQRFLHVSAAGNIYPHLPNDTAATLGSAFNAAARRPLPGGLNNLRNTLVVENTTSSAPSAGVPVRPVCLTSTSKTGGQISAVGNDIHSLGAPGTGRLLTNGGTSSAAPQVAGAAAMLWALDPNATPEQLIARMTATARAVDVDSAADSRCGTTTPAPGLDFYAAVLATDSAVRSPAREAVLDADADGDFDAQDIAAFRDAFVASTQDGTVDLDYGRHDLNGDGYTGGGRARMDLDASQPVGWTFSRRRDVLGLEIGHDETDVRDLDVLCHEAHGPLYEGDPAARDTFAEQYCLPPVEIVVDPAFPSTVQPGVATSLRIVARRTDLTDPTVRQQPGVRLEYAVTGGNVGAVTGVTGQDGAFSTTATLVPPAEELEIEVIARAGEGGPELDRLTVVANRPASGQVSITSVRSNATAVTTACVGECTEDREEQVLETFGPFSGSAGASSSKSGSGIFEGHSSSASANASQESQINAIAAAPEIVASGSASGSGQETSQGSASYSGQAGAAMRFRVLSGTVQWSAQGSSSGTGTIFFIFRHGAGGGFAAFVQNQNVDTSGTLGPGDYEMAAGSSCTADTPSSCTSSYSINFDIDP
jgi:Subtilase family